MFGWWLVILSRLVYSTERLTQIPNAFRSYSNSDKMSFFCRCCPVVPAGPSALPPPPPPPLVVWTLKVSKPNTLPVLLRFLVLCLCLE